MNNLLNSSFSGLRGNRCGNTVCACTGACYRIDDENATLAEQMRKILSSAVVTQQVIPTGYTLSGSPCPRCGGPMVRPFVGMQIGSGEPSGYCYNHCENWQTQQVTVQSQIAIPQNILIADVTPSKPYAKKKAVPLQD